MNYRIRLDAGRGSVLAWCSSCPAWRELRGASAAALDAAADHALAVHDDAKRAAELRRQARDTRDTPRRRQ